MLREEAISVLYGMKGDYFNLDLLCVKDKYEALVMAIKALEQEPCEDCISRKTARRIVDSGRTRQQMIDMILATPPVNPQEQYYKELAESYEKTINKLTKAIAEQEPKTGHWIEEDMFDGDIAYRCSECDEPFCLIDGTPTDNMYNFCPNCGAKMESEDR